MIYQFIICVAILELFTSLFVLLAGFLAFEKIPKFLSSLDIIRSFCLFLLPFNIVIIILGLITKNPIFLGLYAIPLLILCSYIYINIFKEIISKK